MKKEEIKKIAEEFLIEFKRVNLIDDYEIVEEKSEGTEYIRIVVIKEKHSTGRRIWEDKWKTITKENIKQEIGISIGIISK